MGWISKDLLIAPSPTVAWRRTHAMLPCVDPIGDDKHRVYFSGRDGSNRSQIGWVDVNVDAAAGTIMVIGQADAPALAPGALGCFDDSGVTPSCVVNVGGKKLLYYIGWNRASSVRMGLIAGLAESSDGGRTFHRVSRAPILERTDTEPLGILTAPCVRFEDGRWRMWYVSGIEWVDPDLPRYDIKYAESDDGVRWRRDGLTRVALGPGENALARPWVIRKNCHYAMWYGYKGQNYKIGYAESRDGLTWLRRDDAPDADVPRSVSGWDDQMQEYAHVFEHKGRRFMLYNGNGYGMDGAGYAVWIHD